MLYYNGEADLQTLLWFIQLQKINEVKLVHDIGFYMKC